MKRYVTKTFLFLLAGLFSVALFNALVDPLDIYRIVRRPGFNEMKPKLGKFSRLAKPIWLCKRPYERLILGSSRSEIGIPVAEEGWGSIMGLGINGAVSGGRMIDVAEIFQHATLVSPVKNVALGVDFFMFHGQGQGAYTSPQVLAQYNSNSKLFFNQVTYTLFSFNTTGASFYTLTRQRPKYDKFSITGQMKSDRLAKKAQKKGYPVRFKRFTDLALSSSPSEASPVDTEQALNLFKKTLSHAAQKKIAIKIFVTPAHARMLSAMDLAGFTPLYINWKKNMVKIVAQVRSEHPNASIELWDFSGFNAYTTEKFPAPGGRMLWYIDSSHFTSELGQLIIDKMYNNIDKAHDFGTLLTPESLEAEIKHYHDGLDLFKNNNPEIFEELELRFQTIKKNKKIDEDV